MGKLSNILVTDRTQADIARLLYLRALFDPVTHRWTGTAAEKAEWDAGLRGAYTFKDWNRVLRAVAWLAGQLKEYGYSFPEEPVAYLAYVEAYPQSAGSAAGALGYQGETVTVKAEARRGYSFKRWTEGGETVSETPEYSFPAERDRTLTAEFEAGGDTAYSVVGSAIVGISRITPEG